METEKGSAGFLRKVRSSAVNFFQRHIGKGTLLLLGFLLINTGATNLIQSKFVGCRIKGKRVVYFRDTGLTYIKLLLSLPTKNRRHDSWLYLYRARLYIHKNPKKNMYKEFYFHYGMKFQYPPPCILFMEPFRKLSPRKLIVTANTISWIGIFISIFFLADIFSLSLKRFAPEKKALFGGYPARLFISFCFTAGFYPVISSYGLGQIQAWIYLLFVFAVWLWMRGKGIFSGVPLGIISLIKPQFSLYFLWGLIRKNVKFVISWIVPVAILGSISIFTYGWHHHIEYIRFLYYISKYGESYYQNQSLNGLLYRLFRIGPNVHPITFLYAPYNSKIHMGNYIALVLFLVPALFIGRKEKGERTGILDFSIAALSFTLVSPIAWIHHFSIMLPLYALAFPLVLKKRKRILYLGVFILSYFFCSNLLYVTNYFARTRLSFLQSLTFFGALMFLGLLYSLRTETPAPDHTAKNSLP